MTMCSGINGWTPIGPIFKVYYTKLTQGGWLYPHGISEFIKRKKNV